MKYSAEVRITLREGILDTQGKTTEASLQTLDFKQITNVRIGKIIRLRVDAPTKDDAMRIVDDASKKLLANPIIEDYTISISEN